MEETYKILVVDDEPVNLRMMERLLRRHYEVLTASNGQEALDILRCENVSLLMSDHRMPGMSGIELLRKSQSINSHIVCMLVTANTDNDTFTEAINAAGALRVIHKPWDPDIVLQFVKEALAQRETFLECMHANAEIEQVMNQLKLATQNLNLFPKRE